MTEQGEARYCPHGGQEVGAEDRFCSNCGYSLSVPPPGEGRVETGQVNVPPPPTSASPIQEGLGSFLRTFGIGAGACLGLVVAFLVLFAGCAVIAGLSGGGG